MTRDPAALAWRALRAWASRPPFPRALEAGRRLGRVAGSLARYRRRDARRALRAAFPEAGPGRIRAILDGMYGHLGMNLVETLRLPDEDAAGLKARMEWDGLEILERERAAGRGALVLTAHTGNWEAVCAATPLFGLPLTIVAKPIRGRVLREHMRAVRTRFGLTVLPSRGAYRDCLRALRRNDLLGFVLDQNMIRDEGVFVEFFGRPACTTPGLAHIAARSGARVIPVFSARGPDGRHRIRVGAPMDPPRDAGPESLRDATQLYTKRIEAFIREYPEQWIWIHRRWKTRPGPAPGPDGFRQSSTMSTPIA